MTRRDVAVLAVDGGNSKTDVALVAADGALLAFERGPTSSHQAVGLEAGMDNLGALVDRALARADLLPGGTVARLGIYSLAGADYPSDVRLLRRALAGRGLAREDVVLNDTFGALRAGTARPWGVVLVCGQGVNAAAVAPDGRRARFAGVGSASGDWGGGRSVGEAGHQAAVRARDGRGPRTSLAASLPRHFGLRTPEAVARALYEGRIADERLAELAPLVFAEAGAGDSVARGIVDRLADELIAMATALIRRLRLGRTDPDVVLAGGVFRTDDRPFLERLERGVRVAAPGASLVRLAHPPVAGSALLGLDRLSADGRTPPAAEARLRAGFAAWDPAARAGPGVVPGVTSSS